MRYCFEQKDAIRNGKKHHSSAMCIDYGRLISSLPDISPGIIRENVPIQENFLC